MPQASLRVLSNRPYRHARRERPHSRADSPYSDLAKCPADPRAVVLLRLKTLAFHHLVGVFVPNTIGEIMPEHRGGGLGFRNDAERHVTLGKAHQRLLDMARGLVARHHHFEPVDGADKILLALVITADGHFLGGELVTPAFDLAPRARSIFGIGEF